MFQRTVISSPAPAVTYSQLVAGIFAFAKASKSAKQIASTPDAPSPAPASAPDPHSRATGSAPYAPLPATGPAPTAPSRTARERLPFAVTFPRAFAFIRFRQPF